MAPSIIVRRTVKARQYRAGINIIRKIGKKPFSIPPKIPAMEAALCFTTVVSDCQSYFGIFKLTYIPQRERNKQYTRGVISRQSTENKPEEIVFPEAKQNAVCFYH